MTVPLLGPRGGRGRRRLRRHPAGDDVRDVDLNCFDHLLEPCWSSMPRGSKLREHHVGGLRAGPDRALDRGGRPRHPASPGAIYGGRPGMAGEAAVGRALPGAPPRAGQQVLRRRDLRRDVIARPLGAARGLYRFDATFIDGFGQRDAQRDRPRAFLGSSLFDKTSSTAWSTDRRHPRRFCADSAAADRLRRRTTRSSWHRHVRSGCLYMMVLRRADFDFEATLGTHARLGTHCSVLSIVAYLPLLGALSSCSS